MKDEIKEILDKLKDTADTSFFAVCGSQEELDKMPKSITKILSIPSKDAKILLDYITNLQQIEQDHQKLNGELREEIERLNNIIGAIEEDIEVERMSTWAPGPLYLTELMEKIKKLKEGK